MVKSVVAIAARIKLAGCENQIAVAPSRENLSKLEMVHRGLTNFVAAHSRTSVTATSLEYCFASEEKWIKLGPNANNATARGTARGDKYKSATRQKTKRESSAANRGIARRANSPPPPILVASFSKKRKPRGAPWW